MKLNSILTEDLEAAERITISRKFKDDVVRPILKVGVFGIISPWKTLNTINSCDNYFVLFYSGLSGGMNS